MIWHDLSRVFGSMSRWLIATLLGWFAYVAGSLIYLEQDSSVYLVWNSLWRVIGIVTMLMVFTTIQRLMKGEFKVSDR